MDQEYGWIAIILQAGPLCNRFAQDGQGIERQKGSAYPLSYSISSKYMHTYHTVSVKYAGAMFIGL